MRSKLGRHSARRGEKMRPVLFLVISALLLVCWAESFLMLHVASLMVHLLLWFAALFFAGHLVQACGRDLDF